MSLIQISTAGNPGSKSHPDYPFLYLWGNFISKSAFPWNEHDTVPSRVAPECGNSVLTLHPDWKTLLFSWCNQKYSVNAWKATGYFFFPYLVAATSVNGLYWITVLIKVLEGDSNFVVKASFETDAVIRPILWIFQVSNRPCFFVCLQKLL